jgi:hypothetical protein
VPPSGPGSEADPHEQTALDHRQAEDDDDHHHASLDHDDAAARPHHHDEAAGDRWLGPERTPRELSGLPRRQPVEP